MEQETQALLRTLIEQSKEATEAARTAATAAQRGADRVVTLEDKIESNRLTSVREHQKTREGMKALADRLHALEEHVHGSEPPPPPATPDPVTGKRTRPPSLVEITTEAHEKAESVAEAQAEHEGRVLRKISALEESIAERLDRQDRAYGIDRTGLARLTGPRARRRALELAAFLALVWGAYERARQADASAHAAPAPAAVHGTLTP